MQVLVNHVIDGAQNGAALVATAPATVDTLLGATISTSVVGEDLVVSSGPIDAAVVVTDISTCAGIVHVIDAVLVPDSSTIEVAAAPAPVSDVVYTTDTVPVVAERGYDDSEFAEAPGSAVSFEEDSSRERRPRDSSRRERRGRDERPRAPRV